MFNFFGLFFNNSEKFIFCKGNNRTFIICFLFNVVFLLNILKYIWSKLSLLRLFNLDNISSSIYYKYLNIQFKY